MNDFDTKLESFDEIWFYYNPGRFHSLYARLLERTRLGDRIRRFNHVGEIGQRGPQMNERAAKGMKQRDSRTGHRGTKIGFLDAAQVLDRLQICKAYGPTGKINGPNCQRFRHRDAQSGHWYWEVVELIREARKRNSCSPEVIRQVEEQYSLFDDSPMQEPEADSPPKRVGTSRADLEKRFRDTIVELECAMRERIPSSQVGRDRRTLGNLIHEGEERQLLGRIRLQEARLANEVRNALNHPTTEEVTDGDVALANEVARVIIAELENL